MLSSGNVANKKTADLETCQVRRQALDAAPRDTDLQSRHREVGFFLRFESLPILL